MRGPISCIAISAMEQEYSKSSTARSGGEVSNGPHYSSVREQLETSAGRGRHFSQALKIRDESPVEMITLAGKVCGVNGLDDHI